MRTITIGRDDSCDIVINNERVSRIHANIFRQGAGYVYRDNSSNGTRINGIMVQRREAFVRPGDSVLLADVEAMPWHKVRNLIPLEGEEAYHPRQDRQEEMPVSGNDGIGWIVFGYIFALLGGLLGIIFGLHLALATQTTVQGKMKKFSPMAVTNGWIIFSLALFSIFVQLVILIANG
ncbi:MAG: FHA domain-containing protein [Tannerellaceae bacterium]|jgi:pSer/pThr/pTyr-binding forkhead associated (FHA) protein|nr:FHA domain-containing protein [Tannerellaceae bacterium]